MWFDFIGYKSIFKNGTFVNNSRPWDRYYVLEIKYEPSAVKIICCLPISLDTSIFKGGPFKDSSRPMSQILCICNKILTHCYKADSVLAHFIRYILKFKFGPIEADLNP